jgi:hypothetical protein
MTIRMNAALRRRLVGSALGGFIAFAGVSAAMAQWLPPWRTVAPPADIAQGLEAQGYVLVAPLQRRPGVYLADVRAGPGGYQRLVIDDRNGDILERFIAPPRGFRPEFAARYGPFTEPPPWGAFQPPPGPSFPGAPNAAGPGAKSAYGGPSNLHIPSAISPYGSQPAPVSTKPKSAPTARKTLSPMVAPPLPPPAPREAAKPEETPAAPKPEPKIESPPGESENASSGSANAPPDGKPETPTTERRPEAQTRSEDSAPDPTAKPGAPGSSAESSDKSKVSIVPAALSE